MTITPNNVQDLIKKVKEQIEQEKDLSPALRSSLEMLLLVVTMLVQRLGLNSRNSSTPPSADPNREKRPKSKRTKKPGGQKGHKGNTLQPVEDPDIIQKITLDRSKLPEGQYRDGGYEKRQVLDMDISAIVTEYQAQVLINEQGKKFVAPFPEGVTRPAQ